MSRKVSLIGHLSIPEHTKFFLTSGPLYMLLCLLQCSFSFHMPFYIAHSYFFISQPKLHSLSFVIALFITLLSCLFLASGTFYYIMLYIFCTAWFVYLFMICLLPAECYSLNLTFSNSPLSPWCPDQGPTM